MMKKIQEAAQILGVSRVTVYKKIEILKKDLKSHVGTVGKSLCIDEDGIELIRQSLSRDHIDRAPKHKASESVLPFSSTQVKGQNIEEEAGHNSESEKKVLDLQNALSIKEQEHKKCLRQYKQLQDDYLRSLQLINSLFDNQITIKKRENEDKNRIITSYKEIIGYNKERISKMEEKLYTLFK